MSVRYYWEDFPAGSAREFPPRSLERNDILDFARRFDPQPFHIDEASARESHFGGLIASGWHVCSFAMRMLCDGYLLDTASMGSPGVERIRWHAPARPGDLLRLRSEVLEARLLNSRPGVGLLLTRWEMFNQDDVLVMSMEGHGMVRCRPNIREV